jgi:thiol-disulfide isomerase/thioredoxin
MFVKKIRFFLCILVALSPLGLQPIYSATDYSYAGITQQINVDTITEHMKILSSDEFGGRMVGEDGSTLARDYIADQYEQMQLRPAGDDGTYFQHLTTDVWYPRASLKFNKLNREGEFLESFEYRNDYNICVLSGSGKAKSQVVFAGFGITSEEILEYDDYKEIDVEGKIVAIIRHAPDFFQEMMAEHQELYPHMYFQTKISNAKSHGAVGVIILENPMLPSSSQTNLSIKQGSGSYSDLPCLYMSVDGSNKLLTDSGFSSQELYEKISEDGEPFSFVISDTKVDMDVNIDYTENVDTSNVIGYIPATDPFGMNHTVLITAHYDHVGIDPMGNIYNGADDNASGVSAMLEIARVFSQSNLRAHSNIAFVAFTGEELGLIGSKYMVSDPPFPLQGMTVLNMDMVSGNNNKVFCGLGESHTFLADALKKSCNLVGAEFLRFTPQNNSDHAPFANEGVPAVFIFGNGDMKWHVPDDTFENASMEGIVLISKVVSLTTCLLTDPFYLHVNGDNMGVIKSTNPEYEITGYTGKGCMVYVGGRSTIASESGHFKLNVPLVEGDNEVVITANQFGTGDKITRSVTINYAPDPELELSKDMLNFGYVSEEYGVDPIAFKIINTGVGPIEGTVESCADWLTISPNTLSPDTTTVTATVNPSKVTDMGLNTCILTINTTAGMAFVPVTAVKSSTPIIEVELQDNTNDATLSGTRINMPDEIIHIETGYHYPASVISMAFGADISSDVNRRTIKLRGKTVRFWHGADVAIIDSKPIRLKSPILSNDSGESFLPEELLSEIGISVSEKDGKHFLSWDATPLKLSIEPTGDENRFKIKTNRNALCVVREYADWMYVYPSIIDTSKDNEFTVYVDKAKLETGTEFTTDINILSNTATTSITYSQTIPVTKKVIEVQIDSKKAYINGNEMILENPPFIHVDTTMVPFRFISEAFGADIKWDGDTKTVFATLGTTIVEIQIDNITGKVNGIPMTLVRSPMIINGRTFVPFRFIGEAFGAEVEWISETKSVKVSIDESERLPKPSLSDSRVELEWFDAELDGIGPRKKVDVRNIGKGNLIVTDVMVVGEGLKASIDDSEIVLQPLYIEEGLRGASFVIINTNGGSIILDVQLNICPKDSVVFECNETNTWYINGQVQTDPVYTIDGLYSTNVGKVISAVGGTYGYDYVSKDMNVFLAGHHLRLSTISGDFWMDDQYTGWRFDYDVINEDEVVLPWSTLALAFDWEISESPYMSSIILKAEKEKQSFLTADKPSIDLIYSQSIMSIKMTDFVCPTYPLREDGIYISSEDDAEYRLYCFFDESDRSSRIIPYIESINNRYGDDMSVRLVSAQIPTDMEVEKYIAGNKTIRNQLSDLALTSIDTSILFDDKGQVCDDFPGVSLPRLYIVNSNDNLVFWLPQLDDNQLLYLEQAVVALLDGTGFVPPDVGTVNVENTGGKAGKGKLTSSYNQVKVFSSDFESSPASVAISFDPGSINWDKPYETFEVSVLGNSNSIHIPVRCWNIERGKTITSYHDGASVIRTDGIDINVPSPCTSGDNPIGPIGEILEAMGAEILQPSPNSVRIVAGNTDVGFDIGDSTIDTGKRKVEFTTPFSIIEGVLYGPIKFLSEFTDTTLAQFDNTTVVISTKVKGSISEPRLKVDKTEIQINDYIPKGGGYLPAIDFELESYPRANSGVTRLKTLADMEDVKLVLIDFWATWCPPCKMAMPYLERLHRRYKDDGLLVLGVITDNVNDDEVVSTLESSTEILSNMNKLRLDEITYDMAYDIISDDELSTFRKYNGRSIPRLVLVDEEMNWIHTETGFWEQGMRSLEYRIRRKLGIEENSEMPQLKIMNEGVGVLEGTISSSLDFIRPSIVEFSEPNIIECEFVIDGINPRIPTKGYLTIDSNGGKIVLPILYNPLNEVSPYKITIDTSDATVEINNQIISIQIESIIDEQRVLVDARQLFSILGSHLDVLPDGKRAVGRFEVWDIVAIDGKQKILAGIHDFTAQRKVQIRGNQVFIDFETIAEIMGAQYEPKKGKNKIYLEYQP